MVKRLNVVHLLLLVASLVLFGGTAFGIIWLWHLF